MSVTAVVARPSWASGVAEVVRRVPRGVIIRCPHCGGRHKHGLGVLGSRSIAAGCHAGPGRLREYRVVDTGVAK
ncbi:hypothetical protein [Mycobacterium sp. NPDC004974]